MSPKNKKKLIIQRRKLDKLDNKLLSLIKIRTGVIKKVISLKNNKKEIVDKKRIAYILRKIKKESIRRKIDPTITNKIWKNMIWSYIDFERKNFKKKIIIYYVEVIFFQQILRVSELKGYIFLL